MIKDAQGPERPDDDMAIAEFVLGLLDDAAHTEMAARIAREPALARKLAFWQQKLSGLDVEFAEITPPAHILPAIETRLFGRPAARGNGFWQSLMLWRTLAAGALAVAVLAIGMSLYPALLTTTGPQPAQMVASLATKDMGVSFLATYDQKTGTVRLTRTGGEDILDRNYELWFINAKTAPVSLGVVPYQTNAAIALTKADRARMGPGTVLAVTLEPKGGSPTGKPTGPLLAAGPLTAV